MEFLSLFLHVLVSPFKTRAQLEAEIVLLRHQLNVLRRRVPSKPKLAVADRLLFVWLYRLFPSVLNAVTIVQPETIIRWHRAGFRLYWCWKSRSRGGRTDWAGDAGNGGRRSSRLRCARSQTGRCHPVGRRRAVRAIHRPSTRMGAVLGPVAAVPL